MERTPIKAPLPCYGLEHSPLDPVCCSCPHQTGCLKFMGARANKIALNKLRFDLVPHELKLKLPKNQHDPEAPLLRALYTQCYLTVFGKKPEENDDALLYRDAIVKNARSVNCTLRLFILSNMVAQSIHEKTLIEHTEKGRSTRFNAHHLNGNLAVSRAVQYAKVCRDSYGTFSLSSLSTFNADGDLEKNDMDKNMLTSETTAGQFIVSKKIHRGGPPFEALYTAEEFQLDPYWLAIEPSYKAAVLDAHIKNQKDVSGILKNHRFNVSQARGQMARSFTMQTVAFKSREKIMPQAVERVLSYFNVRPDDLLHEATPVTDPMKLWIQIGRTLQQYHIWLLLQGEPSFFSKHCAKEVHFDWQ